jgi:hypothetical protein
MESDWAVYGKVDITFLLQGMREAFLAWKS